MYNADIHLHRTHTSSTVCELVYQILHLSNVETFGDTNTLCVHLCSLEKQGQKWEEVTAYLLYFQATKARGLGDNTDSYWSLATHLTSYIVFKWTRLQIKGGKSTTYCCQMLKQR